MVAPSALRAGTPTTSSSVLTEVRQVSNHKCLCVHVVAAAGAAAAQRRLVPRDAPERLRLRRLPGLRGGAMAEDGRPGNDRAHAGGEGLVRRALGWEDLLQQCLEPSPILDGAVNDRSDAHGKPTLARQRSLRLVPESYGLSKRTPCAQWQQPHIIWMTELQRLHADTSADAAAIVGKMSSVVEATADFMADFVAPPPAGMGKASELWIGPPADGGEEGDPVNQTCEIVILSRFACRPSR